MLTEPIALPRGEAQDADDMQAIVTDLVQVAARLTRLANRVVKDPGSLATWRTLSVLQASGPMRLGELASLSQVAQPTMTKIVSGLVERDWIKRIADTDDARAWQLGISSKGILALNAWRGKLANALLPRFADLDETDARTLRRAIDLVRPRVVQGPAVQAAWSEREAR